MSPSLASRAALKTVPPLKSSAPATSVPRNASRRLTKISSHLTTMASQPPTAAAPWRAQLLDHISKLDPPTFTFTSLHPGASANTNEPRARTCVFRGMWASLPPNDRNPAARNPPAYESDCLALTTDARMAKVPELFGPGGEASSSSSGGGGPVEAMFWVPAAGTQWRLRGRAWVLSHADIGGAGGDDSAGSPGAKAAREAISARMRPTTNTNGGDGDGWSWEREVEAHFGNLSPGMRGSFKNPPPGAPRAEGPGPGEGLGLGQKVGDELLGDEVARRNFRVVVVVPDEVDTWDGADPEDQRRWVYTFVGPGAKAARPGGEVIAGWEKVEVWP